MDFTNHILDSSKLLPNKIHKENIILYFRNKNKMVTYICEKCGNIYNKKIDYTRHINRKFSCDKKEIKQNIESLQINSQVNQNSSQNKKKNHICCYCKYEFTNKSNLNRHVNIYCKEKKQRDEEKNSVLEQLKNEMNKIKDKLIENDDLKNKINKQNDEMNELKNKLNENEELKKQNNNLQGIINNALLNDNKLIYSVKHPKPKKPHLVCTTDVASSSDSLQPLINKPSIFTFNDKTFVYAVDKKGIIWFNGKEVVSFMGYRNPQEAIREHINKKYVTTFEHIDRVSETLTLDYNEKNSIYISEFGLYQLLTTSKLKNPIINEFQDLLFEEILPSIRKTGKYEIPNLFSNIKCFYNDNMITSFIDKKVVYIGITSNTVVNNGIVEMLAKFGKTGGIIERDIEKHRRFYDDFKIIFIRECDNYEDIEKLFKFELIALNLHRKVEIKGITCNELFTVKEDYTMDNVINMLNKLIDNNPLKSIKELKENVELEKIREITKQKELDIRQKELENEKIKMEIKKLELENEKYKLKNNRK